MRHPLPYARAGQRIGLLGGSFDPAHDGHVHITLQALKRFNLDRVWWLVSPGNPLKAKGPAALDRRMAVARDVMQHPRVRVTDLEASLGTRYTADTLAALTQTYPGVRFTWLMGADNLHQFHKWDRWQMIMGLMPVGVLARPGDRIDARTSVAARAFWQDRLKRSHQLSGATAPAWCFINVPMRNESSSAIRAAGDWR